MTSSPGSAIDVALGLWSGGVGGEAGGHDSTTDVVDAWPYSGSWRYCSGLGSDLSGGLVGVEPAADEEVVMDPTTSSAGIKPSSYSRAIGISGAARALSLRLIPVAGPGAGLVAGLLVGVPCRSYSGGAGGGPGLGEASVNVSATRTPPSECSERPEACMCDALRACRRLLRHRPSSFGSRRSDGCRCECSCGLLPSLVSLNVLSANSSSSAIPSSAQTPQSSFGENWSPESEVSTRAGRGIAMLSATLPDSPVSLRGSSLHSSSRTVSHFTRLIRMERMLASWR